MSRNGLFHDISRFSFHRQVYVCLMKLRLTIFRHKNQTVNDHPIRRLGGDFHSPRAVDVGHVNPQTCSMNFYVFPTQPKCHRPAPCIERSTFSWKINQTVEATHVPVQQEHHRPSKGIELGIIIHIFLGFWCPTVTADRSDLSDLSLSRAHRPASYTHHRDIHRFIKRYQLILIPM